MGNCANDLQKFIAVCKEIGVPIKENKTVGPCTCLTFMGLELDSGRHVCPLINLKRLDIFKHTPKVLQDNFTLFTVNTWPSQFLLHRRASG